MSDREPCPHCGQPSGPGGPAHVCPDTTPWTQAEKDAFRAQARRWYPAVPFGPSTDQLAARFGERNRKDREAEVEARGLSGGGER